jgi:hypothetical protein
MFYFGFRLAKASLILLLTLGFQNMSSQGENFWWGHYNYRCYDALQAKAGHTVFSEFVPVVEGPKQRIAEILLWVFYQLGLCCTVVQFAVYKECKLAFHPDFITVFVINHPQICALKFPFYCKFILFYLYLLII